MVIVAFIICQCMVSAGAMSRSLRGQLVPICVYIVMAVSLNLTVGISGELSLGHAGFMSVGAFSGIVAVEAGCWAPFPLENDVVRLLLAMVVGGVFAGIAGVIIGVPVLRLRGDYLAIVTLAFGEIIRNVINCLYISVDAGACTLPSTARNIPGELLVNGPAGATGVEPHLHVRAWASRSSSLRSSWCSTSSTAAPAAPSWPAATAASPPSPWASTSPSTA